MYVKSSVVSEIFQGVEAGMHPNGDHGLKRCENIALHSTSKTAHMSIGREGQPNDLGDICSILLKMRYRRRK